MSEPNTTTPGADGAGDSQNPASGGKGGAEAGAKAPAKASKSKPDAKPGPATIGAPAAEDGEAKAPAWQAEDYTGPLSCEQAAWRARELKPAGTPVRK